MNKKLLAVAIAGAMAAPLAAQADTTIFGQMHLSADWVDNGEDDALNIMSNSSYISFRGREDLGGGNFASWQIFNFIRSDVAAGGFSSGNTFAGLGGGWGEVRVGRHDTPLKTIHRRVDLFGNQIGDSRNLGIGLTPGDRFNNMAMYVSPSVGGVQGSLMYSTNLDTGSGTVTSDNDGWSANLTYSQGPIWLGAAYTSIDGRAGAQLDQAWGVGARFNWQAFTVTGLWYRDETEAGVDRDVWGLGAAYTLGNNTIKAQYYDAGNFVGDDGGNLWALGVDHRLSKRTVLYAAYAQTDNDPNSAFRVTGGGHDAPGNSPGLATPVGEDPQAFSLGVIHNF